MAGSRLGTASTVESKEDTALPPYDLQHVDKQMLNKK